MENWVSSFTIEGRTNTANYEKLLMFPLSMKNETVFNEKEDVYCYKLPCVPGALKKSCL